MKFFRRSSNDEFVENSDTIARETFSGIATIEETGLVRTRCLWRFLDEQNVCQPWFLVVDSTGRVLDIPESFSPAGWADFIWKLTLTLICIGTFAFGMIKYDAKFFMAFFTNWGTGFSSAYAIFSLINTVAASRTTQPDEKTGPRITCTWVLFELSAHISGLASIIFWAFLYDVNTQLNYYNVVAHGPLCILVLIDGLFVNRIPVRFMHWYGIVLPFEVLYMFWTYVHQKYDIGNPDESDNDPTTDDDKIYKAIDWYEDGWRDTLVLAAGVLLLLGPIFYTLMWLLSLYQYGLCCKKDRRRYVDSFKDEKNPRPTVDDVEEGSVFARWW